MEREDEKEDAYANQNIAVITGRYGKETKDRDATRIQSSEHTERDQKCVNLQKEVKCSIAAAVCLVLLCVLLSIAVIVMCVLFTQERQQLTSKNEDLTNERNQLTSKNEDLTNERNQLTSKNEDLTNERNQLKLKKSDLQKSLGKMNRWIYYQFSFYFISSENKSWTESRKYCTERGADLIIINNKEEQDFVKNISGTAMVYIGLTDSDVENTWKWVDGSTLTSGIWGSGEPNGGTRENCVVNIAIPTRPDWGKLVGWIDVECQSPFQWICEKNISQLILP